MQALHASAPLIAIWDDHEHANDPWKTGAENHNEDGKHEGALRVPYGSDLTQLIAPLHLCSAHEQRCSLHIAEAAACCISQARMPTCLDRRLEMAFRLDRCSQCDVAALRSEHIAALPKATVLRSVRRNMRRRSSSFARFVASAGSWAARTERSTRVYHEYMPIRGGTYGESDYVGKKIWRSFDMGDLAKVVAVEMRLTVRSGACCTDCLTSCMRCT